MLSNYARQIHGAQFIYKIFEIKFNYFTRRLSFFYGLVELVFFSQCSCQETDTLSPDGIPMSNIAVYC